MNLHRILLFGMITTTQHHCQRYPQVGYTFHFKLITTDDAVLRAVKYTFHIKMITTHAIVMVLEKNGWMYLSFQDDNHRFNNR